MIKINLLPEEVISRERRRKQRKNMISFSIAFVFLLTVITLFKIIQDISITTKLSEIKMRLEKKYKPIVVEIKKLEKLKSDLERKKKMIENLTNSGLKYPKLLEEIVRILPPGIWLQSLTARPLTETSKTKKTRETKTKPSALIVSLNCFSWDNFQIVNFLRNLINSSKLKYKSISTITPSQPKKYRFSVSLEYEG